ncbi:MAG: hypothetical protein BWY57_01560 [Betaproteobacteria bacterium ADurb.Bin341]|nr:MAG: hypothetical protein BWY57_01560 [Betaproteobacteria bacterium ADurb.Bin341]
MSVHTLSRLRQNLYKLPMGRFLPLIVAYVLALTLLYFASKPPSEGSFVQTDGASGSARLVARDGRATLTVQDGLYALTLAGRFTTSFWREPIMVLHLDKPFMGDTELVFTLQPPHTWHCAECFRLSRSFTGTQALASAKRMIREDLAGKKGL